MKSSLNNRADKFKELSTHAWFKKSYTRLTKSDIDLCELFIAESLDLNSLEFERKVNRLFLDKEKPKNWALITELLIACQ
jgi:hypothetical protein